MLWCFEGVKAVNKMTAKCKKVIHSKYANKKQQNLLDRLLVCLQGQNSRKGSVHESYRAFFVQIVILFNLLISHSLTVK